MNRKNSYENRITALGNNEILRLKSELLCLGLKVSDDFLHSVDGYFLEHDFVHGSQILIDNNIVVNVPVNENYVLKYSPYELLKVSKEWTITKNGFPITRCKPLLMPHWVNLPLDNSVKVGDLVRPHSDTILFCTPIKKCVFEKINKKCKFCTFPGNEVNRNFSLDLIEEGFKIIFSEENNYIEVALGGATPNLKDFGVSYYSKLAKTIKEIRPDIKISVEIIPPWNLELLYDLHSSGADSIIMNIEIFDDEIRRNICPGKSGVQKSHYFKAWEKSLNIFGENRVSSVLIVGLENKESTIKGAKKMLEMGVIPTLIPFRPYIACELNYLPPVSPEYYLLLCKEIFSGDREYKVNPSRQPGCTRCGGCSLETILTGVRV